MLLLSIGLTLPASSAAQRYGFDREYSQLSLPGLQSFGPQSTTSDGGGFFFSYVYGSGENIVSNPHAFFSSIDIQTEEGQSFPLFAVSSSVTDYFYVRQGNVYYIFPQQDTFENGADSPSAFFAFAPLLFVWLDSERRRSRFRIYVEILDLLKKGPMTPYEVSFHLRLNSKRTREFVEFLAEKKFLDCSEQEGKLVCSITESGFVLVENLRIILEENG